MEFRGQKRWGKATHFPWSNASLLLPVRTYSTGIIDLFLLLHRLVYMFMLLQWNYNTRCIHFTCAAVHASSSIMSIKHHCLPSYHHRHTINQHGIGKQLFCSRSTRDPCPCVWRKIGLLLFSLFIHEPLLSVSKPCNICKCQGARTFWMHTY